MKAIVIYQAGGPDQLKLVDLPTPQLRPGWSLVKIHVFGLNHSEVYTRKGQSPTVHFPRILGIEGVGEIAQTTDPQRLPVGQAVISIMGEMGRNFDGSYAEYALLPNQQIYPVTTDLPWSQLAVFPELLHRLHFVKEPPARSWRPLLNSRWYQWGRDRHAKFDPGQGPPSLRRQHLTLTCQSRADEGRWLLNRD